MIRFVKYSDLALMWNESGWVAEASALADRTHDEELERSLDLYFASLDELPNDERTDNAEWHNAMMLRRSAWEVYSEACDRQWQRTHQDC